MQVIHTPDDVFHHTRNLLIQGKTLGLVPTMGALHEGHLTLVRRSVLENDATVVSIFVNPLQFNNPDDLKNYPRDLESDLLLLEQEGVSVVFAPGETEMYAEKPLVALQFGRMGQVMEGAFRPGHFDGVGVVVSKLLHLCQPHRAYFGLKDLQQYLLVKRLVYDLSFPVEIVGLPIAREASGLAMSSRNARLSANGLMVASQIFQGLRRMKQVWDEGASPYETKMAGKNFYSSIDGLTLEYVEVVSPETLENEAINQRQAVAMCVAAYVEGVRLIDNLYLQPQNPVK